MKNKVLLSILLPATEKIYDVWVSPTSTLDEVTSLVAKILNATEQSFFEKNPEHSFMLKATGTALEKHKTIKELNLYNGSFLVLI